MESDRVGDLRRRLAALHAEGLSVSEIARRAPCSRETVYRYLRRAKASRPAAEIDRRRLNPGRPRILNHQSIETAVRKLRAARPEAGPVAIYRALVADPRRYGFPTADAVPSPRTIATVLRRLGLSARCPARLRRRHPPDQGPRPSN